MAKSLVPSVITCSFENEYLDIHIESMFVDNYIHWLEFCFTFLAPKIAAIYAKQHMNVMPQWAEHMVLQKIAHEIHKYNPIDTLYDMWRNPKDYTQTL